MAPWGTVTRSIWTEVRPAFGAHVPTSVRMLSLRMVKAKAIANMTSVTSISRVEMVLIEGSMVRRMLDQM